MHIFCANNLNYHNLRLYSMNYMRGGNENQVNVSNMTFFYNRENMFLSILLLLKSIDQLPLTINSSV